MNDYLKKSLKLTIIDIVLLLIGVFIFFKSDADTVLFIVLAFSWIFLPLMLTIPIAVFIYSIKAYREVISPREKMYATILGTIHFMIIAILSGWILLN